MTPEEEDLSGLVEFIFELGQLKRTPRTGGAKLGIKQPETVADHSFRSAAIGFLLAEMEGYDPYQVAGYCLFHDAAETRTGDLDWLAHEQKVLDSNVLIHSYVQGIARAVFDILDADNDGVISKEEYLKFFRSFRGNVEDAEIAFQKLDDNDDGYLTRQSFLEAVTEFHLSDDPDARGNWLFGPYEEASSSA